MIKMTPLKQWICDSCGLVIEEPEDGWLEWYRELDTEKETGFRIVHHKKICMYNAQQQYNERKSVMDMHLDNYVGSDGLVKLLTILEYHSLKDKRDVVEIIRRLHVPHYEEARQYWLQAKADGYFDGANEVFPYIQSTLLDIISRYSE